MRLFPFMSFEWLLGTHSTSQWLGKRNLSPDTAWHIEYDDGRYDLFKSVVELALECVIAVDFQRQLLFLSLIFSRHAFK